MAVIVLALTGGVPMSASAQVLFDSIRHTETVISEDYQWSCDGTELYYTTWCSRPYDAQDVCVLSVKSLKRDRIIHHEDSDLFPMPSPSADQLIWQGSNDLRAREVYLADGDGANRVTILSIPKSVSNSWWEFAWWPGPWCSDGSKIAYLKFPSDSTPYLDACIYDLESKTTTVVASNAFSGGAPVWRPGDSAFAYVGSPVDGGFGVWLTSASTPPVNLIDVSYRLVWLDWADSDNLLLGGEDPDTIEQFHIQTGGFQTLSEDMESYLSLSSDGKYVAGTRYEDIDGDDQPEREVWVARADGSHFTRLPLDLSIAKGHLLSYAPRWSPADNTLSFLTPGDVLNLVAVKGVGEVTDVGDDDVWPQSSESEAAEEATGTAEVATGTAEVATGGVTPADTLRDASLVESPGTDRRIQPVQRRAVRRGWYLALASWVAIGLVAGWSRLRGTRSRGTVKAD